MGSCRLVEHGTADYWQTVKLREQILRQPLGLAFSAEELEAEADSFHIAYYEDKDVVGCLVLKPVNQKQIVMRQVAVAADRQGQGIGRELVIAAEQFAVEHGFLEMGMHARESAAGFYEKLGYKREGERFTQVTLPHFHLRKSLERASTKDAN